MWKGDGHPERPERCISCQTGLTGQEKERGNDNYGVCVTVCLTCPLLLLHLRHSFRKYYIFGHAYRIVKNIFRLVSVFWEIKLIFEFLYKVSY